MAKNESNEVLERWAGLISVQRKRGWYIGSAGNTAWHAPHAVKICFALESGDSFDLSYDKHKRPISAQAAIIAPDRIHRIDGNYKNFAVFYLMPETAEAHKVLETYLNNNRGFAIISRSVVGDLSVRLSSLVSRWRCSGGEALDVGNHLFHSLKLSPSLSWRESLDERVRRAVEYIETKVVDKILLGEIAQNAFASSSRLMHVFSDETNLAIRRYKIWLKLREAVRCMSVSKSLDYIANAAGFYDRREINKYFLEMHGILPAELVGHSKIVDSY